VWQKGDRSLLHVMSFRIFQFIEKYQCIFHPILEILSENKTWSFTADQLPKKGLRPAKLETNSAANAGLGSAMEAGY